MEQINDVDRKDIINAIEEAESTSIVIALRDPWYFCTEYAYTIDEHDSDHPIKKFPDYSYLEMLTDTWMKNKKLLVAKTRQMTVSWLFVVLHLWLALRPGQSIFFQSKKEDDANALLERCKFVYRKLPLRLKWGMVLPNMNLDLSKEPAMREIYCKLEFPWLNSYIQAVPQGSDVLRSKTASAIFSDEMAFQDKAKEAYEASKPTIDGGGRFTGVSTPNGHEFFYDLVFDCVG